ncbi:AAA family ATPase [Allomuricauda sp. NBRC 101325]|uniref:AAA family ATPase n=1 Tax=Allomuricauda sp. NBRC 101325 TaxID=1113758 RepID=UPI0024A475AC|nr:AAA family ATPase [Muricauda sp. NBRC 101325]GLU45411.1 hypothetical protein Musp01_30350 [Muricauda sp. NBRC 101325]
MISKPKLTRPTQHKTLVKISTETNPYYVITGGPGVGKTTLLHELKQRGFMVVPEIARELIKEQQAIDGDALPWKNKNTYRDLMFDRSIESFEKIMDEKHVSGPIFLTAAFWMPLAMPISWDFALITT